MIWTRANVIQKRWASIVVVVVATLRSRPNIILMLRQSRLEGVIVASNDVVIVVIILIVVVVLVVVAVVCRMSKCRYCLLPRCSAVLQPLVISNATPRKKAERTLFSVPSSPNLNIGTCSLVECVNSRDAVTNTAVFRNDCTPTVER